MRLCAADELLGAEGQPRAWELAAEQRQVPLVGAGRRKRAQFLDVDLLRRDHVASEHHRLEVEAARVGQQVGDAREQAAIDLLLSPAPEVIGSTEVLEGAEARDCVERAEAVATDLARIVEVDVQAVTAARPKLRSRA